MPTPSPAVDCQAFCAVRDFVGGSCWAVADCETWCLNNSGALTENEINAFGFCVATDPLCFQTVEQCIANSDQ